MIPQIVDWYIRQQKHVHISVFRKILNTRTARKIGIFGKFWRWAYSAYDKRLEAEYKKRLSQMSLTEYVREKIREEGFKRKILPVDQLGLYE